VDRDILWLITVTDTLVDIAVLHDTSPQKNKHL